MVGDLVSRLILVYALLFQATALAAPPQYLLCHLRFLRFPLLGAWLRLASLLLTR